MSFRNELKKYISFSSTAQKEVMNYPANLFGRIIIHVFRILALGFIYSYLFSLDTFKGDFTLSQAVWSLGLIQIIYQSSRNVYRTVKEDILFGKISVVLNKPYNYLLSVIFTVLGEASFKVGFFIIVTVIPLALIWGIPTFTTEQLIFLIVSFILGVILNTVVDICLGLTAFWVENSDPIYWIVTKISWVFSGTFIPLAIMPDLFKNIAFVFPLSVPFYIGRVFEFDNSLIIKAISVMVIWLLVLSFLSLQLFNRGLKKISINGG